MSSRTLVRLESLSSLLVLFSILTACSPSLNKQYTDSNSLKEKQILANPATEGPDLGTDPPGEVAQTTSTIEILAQRTRLWGGPAMTAWPINYIASQYAETATIQILNSSMTFVLDEVPVSAICQKERTIMDGQNVIYHGGVCQAPVGSMLSTSLDIEELPPEIDSIRVAICPNADSLGSPCNNLEPAQTQGSFTAKVTQTELFDNTTLEAVYAFEFLRNAEGVFQPNHPASGLMQLHMKSDGEFFVADGCDEMDDGIPVGGGECEEDDNVEPIVIDLSGNGIKTAAVGRNRFDLDADGSLDHASWIDNSDPERISGLLTYDRNRDGVINDGTELFGNFTPVSRTENAAEGFAALRYFDKNGDNVIDSKDWIYSRLRVWVDRGQLGKTEAGELHSLESLDIASISLEPVRVEEMDIHFNWTILRSAVTFFSGKTSTASDIWFNVARSR